MKKMVLVLTMVAFALSGSAFAQEPTYQNNIGLKLADNTTCGSIGENTTFTVYIVLSKVTASEIWGWEAKIRPENVTRTAAVIYGDNVDAGTLPGEHIIGLASPLFVTDGAVVVAAHTYGVFAGLNDINLPSYVFVEGVYFSSIPPLNGPPAYLAEFGGDPVELHPALGDPLGQNPDIPQLIINGDCNGPVAVEESSFGSVKSLFR